MSLFPAAGMFLTALLLVLFPAPALGRVKPAPDGGFVFEPGPD